MESRIRVGRRFDPRWPSGTTGTAWITHNLIDEYQKGGIVVDNQDSFATIDHNEIVGPWPPAGSDRTERHPGQPERGCGRRVTTSSPRTRTSGAITAQASCCSGHRSTLTRRMARSRHRPMPSTSITTRSSRNDDGIALYDTDISVISHNRSYQQRRYDGIYVNFRSMGNTIDHNDAYLNTEHDCHDDSPEPAQPEPRTSGSTTRVTPRTALDSAREQRSSRRAPTSRWQRERAAEPPSLRSELSLLGRRRRAPHEDPAPQRPDHARRDE